MNPLMAVKVIDGAVSRLPQKMRGGRAPEEGGASELEEQAQQRASGAAAQMGTAQTDTLEAGICLQGHSDQGKGFIQTLYFYCD